MTDVFLHPGDALETAQGTTLQDVRDWLTGNSLLERLVLERKPLAELDHWSFEEGASEIVHDSGRFFSVRGLTVSQLAGAAGNVEPWSQPVIHQPEVGLLGILVREIDGFLHLLMQAKLEPGNINGFQLSPTVQATRSNLARVHGGSTTKYVEYFLGPQRGRVLVDALQSEKSAVFYQKRNRNMIVAVQEDVPLYEGFRWVTLGQVRQLLGEANLVNFDSRSVLANLPLIENMHSLSEISSLHSESILASFIDDAGILEICSWFNTIKANSDLATEFVSLAGLPGWHRTPMELAHHTGRHFRIVGVHIGQSNREVAGWDQPLVESYGQGVLAFLTRRRGRSLEVLVQARSEAGTRDVVELAPTVQANPANHADRPPEARAPYLDSVLSAPPERIMFDTTLSEEGGRFFHEENRHLIVRATQAEASAPTPGNFRWCTLGQLSALLRHSGYVNSEARSLIACLHALW